jgi:hypothetical protein
VALVLGFLTGQWLVVPVFGVVLFLGAAFGPKWGPVLRVYGALIRPRLKPPHELEDPRPPRFAATVGVVFLGASTLAFLFGASTLGWTLALIVAALAAAAATTGICVGCEMYVLLVRLRGGVRVVTIEREESELFVEQISTQQTGDSVLVLNVAEHLDLASSYKVRRAPTVVRADANGTVIVRLAGADSVRAELDAMARESVTVI